MAGVLWCETLMATDVALALQKRIEDTTGAPCPCKQGLACPLLPLRPREAERVA